MDCKINNEICFSKNEDNMDIFDEVDFINEYELDKEEEEDFNSSVADFFFSEEDSVQLEDDKLVENKFVHECNIYSIYNPSYPAKMLDSYNVKFSIPCSFLPLSQQVVYGLSCHPILLEVNLELSQNDWKLKPRKLKMVHPIKGTNFIGSPLIHNVASSFFSIDYKPKEYYRAQSLLFSFKSVEPDQKMVKLLVSKGFNSDLVKKALIFANNDLSQATLFLKSGNMFEEEVQTPISYFVSYHDSPLIYFVLEIAEVFLNLSQCCCICGKKLPYPGVKPSICNSELCKFSLYEIGIGTSVCEEINLDPEAADLMVSIYASSFNSDFCKPSYPKYLGKTEIEKILTELPPMSELSKCKKDSELIAKIGKEAFELLKWIVLSNLSFIVSLPQSMKISQFPETRQFLTLISSPEAEIKFNKLRKRYGSIFLWHGSPGNRWHSIVRNGLKVGSGTHLQLNGASLGRGIYFSEYSSTSWGYVRSSTNTYSKSELGRDLKLIALCEVAKVPELINHGGGCRTTVREEAVIVRYLITGNYFSVNVVVSPPELPSMREVLENLDQRPKN